MWNFKGYWALGLPKHQNKGDKRRRKKEKKQRWQVRLFCLYMKAIGYGSVHHFLRVCTNFSCDIISLDNFGFHFLVFVLKMSNHYFDWYSYATFNWDAKIRYWFSNWRGAERAVSKKGLCIGMGSCVYLQMFMFFHIAMVFEFNAYSGHWKLEKRKGKSKTLYVFISS